VSTAVIHTATVIRRLMIWHLTLRGGSLRLVPAEVEALAADRCGWFRRYENLFRRWRHLRRIAAAGSGGTKTYFGGGGTCGGSLRLVPEARKPFSEVEALAADRCGWFRRYENLFRRWRHLRRIAAAAADSRGRLLGFLCLLSTFRAEVVFMLDSLAFFHLRLRRLRIGVEAFLNSALAALL
jgi:hypothetical protein